MRLSNFDRGTVSTLPSVVVDNDLPEVDNFPVSDFFFKGGLYLRDVDVFARSEADPELRQRMSEYMIEREVAGAPVDSDPDDVLESIENRLSVAGALAAVRYKLASLRKDSREARKKKSTTEE